MIKTYLPEEVVIQILLRLPTDSLVRFKCLCKSWYNLIESPQIVAMQLRNKSSLCILVDSWSPCDNDKVEPGSSVWSLLTYDDRMQVISDGENVSFARRQRVDSPSCYENVRFSSSNHCDGIICLYDFNSDGTTIMTNPGIREFMVLPESCIPLPTVLYECRRETTFFGFGLDQVTNDYKVVRILEFASLYGSPEGYPQAEVYTLSSNSWRQVEFTDYWLRSCEFNLSNYWNGACYWPTEQCKPQNDDWIRGVFSFDFGNEVFQFIIIPEYISLPFVLYEFNETLALISYSYHSMENNFEIWVMDELGFNGIWTKLASIEPLLGVEKPLGFLNSDELLILLSAGIDWRSGTQIASYNIVTKQVKTIYHEDCYCGAMIYNCSLVSINGRRTS